MSGPGTPKQLCALAAACALAGVCGLREGLGGELPGGGPRGTGKTPSYRDIALPGKACGTGISFSPDGRLIATTLGTFTPFVADLQTGKKLPGFEGGFLLPSDVIFSPDGRYLAGVKSEVKPQFTDPGNIDDVEAYTDPLRGPFRANVALWDAGTGAEVKRLAKHDASILHVCFSRDGKRLATASQDGTA
ncbi:MAG: WD40 repeat domain-containing protein, partial [Planctomycetota bacterium]